MCVSPCEDILTKRFQRQMTWVPTEKESKSNRDLEEISRERNEGLQLDMGTCPKKDPIQKHMGFSGDGLMC